MLIRGPENTKYYTDQKRQTGKKEYNRRWVSLDGCANVGVAIASKPIEAI